MNIQRIIEDSLQRFLMLCRTRYQVHPRYKTMENPFIRTRADVQLKLGGFLELEFVSRNKPFTVRMCEEGLQVLELTQEGEVCRWLIAIDLGDENQQQREALVKKIITTNTEVRKSIVIIDTKYHLTNAEITTWRDTLKASDIQLFSSTSL